MKESQYLLHEIAQRIAATIEDVPNLTIRRLAPLQNAQPGDISFFADKKYRSQLYKTAASAVVLHRTECPPNPSFYPLFVEFPKQAYVKLASLFDTEATPSYVEAIHPSSICHPTAVLGKEVRIGPHAVIEANVRIGNRVSIGAHSIIHADCSIGDGTVIDAQVVVYPRASIGCHCHIAAHAVIGKPGFAHAKGPDHWLKIPQLGRVRLNDHVEVGACTTIDRGALEDTVIEEGVIIDNHCHIGHNVFIGKHTAIAGGVIVAGSAHIGAHCQIGGASTINGHIKLVDHTYITGMAMVMRSTQQPGIYSSGIPAQPNKEWRKTASLLLRINHLYEKVKSLVNSHPQ